MLETIYNNINTTVVVLSLGILGFMGMHYSYKKYKTLQELRNIELKKNNEKWDNIIKEYEIYHENINEKNEYIKKKIKYLN